jgi:hypothetical protein
LALGEEPFARVALHDKALLLLAQLIPQSVELFIVGSVDDVAEFMEHGIDDGLKWHELVAVARVS